MKNLFIRVANATSEMWLKKNLKTNPNAYAWLPGCKRELNAIGEDRMQNAIINGKDTHYTEFVLKMSENEIKDRFWSLKTKCELLRKHVWVLADSISTIDEFEVLLNPNIRDSVPSEVWIKVLRYYTPSATNLKTLCQVLPYETALWSIIQAVPQAFNDIKAWQLLDLKNEQSQPDFNKPMWKVITALAVKKPKVWVKQGIELIMNVPPQKLTNNAISILDKLVSLAVENDQDLTQCIAYLYVFHPNMYAKARKVALTTSSPVLRHSIVYTMYPQLMPKLEANAFYGLNCLSQSNAKGNDAQETFNLMTVLLSQIDKDRQAYRLLLQFVGKLSSLCSERDYEFITSQLIIYSNSEDLPLISKYVPENLKSTFRNKMLSLQQTKLIKGSFPFTDWTDEEKIAGVRALIKNNSFPIERIDELDENLKSYAYEFMRTRSQALVLINGSSVEIEKLLNEYVLTEEAEKNMLSMHANYAIHKESYIRKHKLHESSFIYLLKMESYNGFTYLLAYAKTWKLTPKEMAYIMQSQYANKAYLLEQFVKA